RGWTSVPSTRSRSASTGQVSLSVPGARIGSRKNLSNLLLSLLWSVDLLTKVLDRGCIRLGDRECEPLALHQKILAVPFVKAACEIGRTAELLFVAGDLAGLGLPQNKAVLPVKLNHEEPVLVPQVLKPAVRAVARAKRPYQLGRVIFPGKDVADLRD